MVTIVLIGPLQALGKTKRKERPWELCASISTKTVATNAPVNFQLPALCLPSLRSVAMSSAAIDVSNAGDLLDVALDGVSNFKPSACTRILTGAELKRHCGDSAPYFTTLFLPAAISGAYARLIKYALLIP